MKSKFTIARWMQPLVRSESGGALAELAILVPLLVVMLAAVTEVGRLFQAYSTLSKGTRTAARYLSNHQINVTEMNRAKSLVVCGKLACGADDPPLVKNLSANNVCLEATFVPDTPKVANVTVSIPRTAGGCVPMDGAGDAEPYIYEPIFNIGALLQVPSFTLALPIAPSTTMYYMIET